MIVVKECGLIGISTSHYVPKELDIDALVANSPILRPNAVVVPGLSPKIKHLIRSPNIVGSDLVDISLTFFDTQVADLVHIVTVSGDREKAEKAYDQTKALFSSASMEVDMSRTDNDHFEDSLRTFIRKTYHQNAVIPTYMALQNKLTDLKALPSIEVSTGPLMAIAHYVCPELGSGVTNYKVNIVMRQEGMMETVPVELSAFYVSGGDLPARIYGVMIYQKREDCSCDEEEGCFPIGLYVGHFLGNMEAEDRKFTEMSFGLPVTHREGKCYYPSRIISFSDPPSVALERMEDPLFISDQDAHKKPELVRLVQFFHEAVKEKQYD